MHNSLVARDELLAEIAAVIDTLRAQNAAAQTADAATTIDRLCVLIKKLVDNGEVWLETCLNSAFALERELN